MDELYEIMRDLLEIEYNQESLNYILKSLETSYDMENQRETKLLVNAVCRYLESMQHDLNAVIARLDKYIITSKNDT